MNNQIRRSEGVLFFSGANLICARQRVLWPAAALLVTKRNKQTRSTVAIMEMEGI